MKHVLHDLILNVFTISSSTNLWLSQPNWKDSLCRSSCRLDMVCLEIYSQSVDSICFRTGNVVGGAVDRRHGKGQGHGNEVRSENDSNWFLWAQRRDVQEPRNSRGNTSKTLTSMTLRFWLVFLCLMRHLRRFRDHLLEVILFALQPRTLGSWKIFPQWIQTKYMNRMSYESKQAQTEL